MLAAVAAAAALMGGALQDAGSSRHLSPYLVVLMVSVASAMVRVEKRSRVVAAGLLISTLLGFVRSEQRRYQELRPDDSSMAILQCLEDHHQYLAHAPFEDAYRLTFLSHERIIVAPNREEDRYPPYQRAVEAAPEQVHIERTASGMEAVVGGNTLCRASRN